MQERVVVRHLETKDYDTALNYLDQLLAECVASERHTLQKLEVQLRLAKLTEAQTFSAHAAGQPYFRNSAPIHAMRGRITFYSGNEQLAKKQL